MFQNYAFATPSFEFKSMVPKVRDLIRFTKQYFGLHGKIEQILYIVIFATVCIFGYMFCQIASTDEYYSQMGYDTFWFQQDAFLNCRFRHPLISFILVPITYIKALVASIDGTFDTRLVAVITYALFLSYAVVFLFRILKNITDSKSKSLLLIFSFIAMAHVMIQSVVIDSFPISMTFLLFATLLIYIDKKDNIILDNILLALLSGVTVTNGVYLFILFLATEKSVKQAIKRFFKASILLCSLWGALVIYILLKYYISGHDMNEIIWSLTFFDTPQFINNHTISTKLFYIIHLFWKESIAFHCTRINWYAYPIIISIPAAITIASILLTSLVTFASIYTLKSKFTRGLIFWFLYCILLASFYGLEESYIFSAHWTFIIPLLLASVKFKNSKYQHFWYAIIAITSIILFYHNSTTFIGFFAPENIEVI